MFLLLCLLVPFFIFSPASAEDATDVTAAVKRARDSGVPENVLSQMLAFGYKYNLKAVEMANFVNITREAKEENLPIGPLVSKMEEGLGKRIHAGIIERVLRQQLSQYRFTRKVAYKTMNRWSIPTRSLESGELVRLSKTLSMGIKAKLSVCLKDAFFPAYHFNSGSLDLFVGYFFAFRSTDHQWQVPCGF